MKVVFTRNKWPVSRLICWLSGERMSHVAVVFEDALVFQSNLFGVSVGWWSEFKAAHHVVAVVDYPHLGEECEKKLYHAVIDRFVGRRYDFGALIYLLWRGLRWKFFKTRLPKENRLGSPGGLLCTELAAVVLEALGVDAPDNVDLMSPERFFRALTQPNQKKEAIS